MNLRPIERFWMGQTACVEGVFSSGAAGLELIESGGGKWTMVKP